MPIVPSFHGYVPQVQDSGAAGRATVEPPHVDTDSYSRLMAKATAPLDNLASSFADLAQRELARNIKANSDDVELQVMSTINRYMTGDGEHEGFLAKQGKNALDAYPGTIEEMQKEVEKKLVGISPQVRDAVFGRVQDRVESAINRANMYREQESKRYQVSSLDAHTQFLMNSIAENYGDSAFIEKTTASIIDDQLYKEKLLARIFHDQRLLIE